MTLSLNFLITLIFCVAAQAAVIGLNNTKNDTVGVCTLEVP